MRLDLRKVEEQISEVAKQEKVEEERKVLLEKANRDVRKELGDELELLEIQLDTDKPRVIRRVEELMAEFIYGNNVSLGAILNNFIREYGLLVDKRKVIENIYYEGCGEEYAYAVQRGMRISFGSFNEQIYERLIDKYGHRFTLNVKCPSIE